IHRVFLSGDIEASAAILRDPGRSDLFYGFDSLSAQILKLATAAEWREANALSAADSIVRLAQAIGAIRYPYPEAYSIGFGTPATVTPEAAMAAVDTAMGITMPIPNPYPDEHGVRLARGVAAYRMSQAMYQAYCVRRLTTGRPKPAVAEIGGGLGRTAFYARLLGIEDYTIVDLPLSSLAQGYFLGRTISDEGVSLSGERHADDGLRVKLMSPQQFLEGRKRYDLVLNVDSLTEMSRDNASAYIDKCRSNADMLLSINHEFNPFTVHELLAERGLAAKATRSPYPMRDGYLEEFVSFSA
ncbi:MAG: hypothetical protein ACRCTI_20495, partial [Beijerinckiaceae bacterium]